MGFRKKNWDEALQDCKDPVCVVAYWIGVVLSTFILQQSTLTDKILHLLFSLFAMPLCFWITNMSINAVKMLFSKW